MKKILYIILILMVSVCVFADEPKEKEDASAPDVLCLVMYGENSPAILNITFKKEKEKKELDSIFEKFKENYKGDLILIPNTEEKVQGFTATVQNASYKVGSGEALDPFVKTFSGEKKILVIFAGKFEPVKDPLLVYDKGDFSLVLHKAGDNYQYEISPAGGKTKIPASQKVITSYKTLGKIGVAVLWILGIGIVISVLAKLMKNAVRNNKRRKDK
ncbi:MAG: hypothetical protein KBT47_07545 [Armatimonadetes bacterium]|nr:hypothetical protein [Candidatus Hippobium faecium]